jgi:hypothetical protein
MSELLENIYKLACIMPMQIACSTEIFFKFVITLTYQST